MNFVDWVVRRLRKEGFSYDVVEPRLSTGSYFLRQGDYANARHLLLQALEHRDKISNPATLIWLFESLNWTWIYVDQYSESAEFFSEYIARHPGDAIAYAMRAGALWYSGELERAIVDYSRSIELDPTYVVAHMGRGQVLVECGNFSSAIADLDFALENLGQLPVDNALWKDSIRAFALNGRAAAHAGLGKLDLALQEFQESISLCPGNAFVYYNRGQVYVNKGDRVRAAADFKAALRMNDPKLTSSKREYAEIKLKSLIG